jgi:hypothetical protein
VLRHLQRARQSSACTCASPPTSAARAELPTSSCSPDVKRADRIGEFWGYPESRTFAELLIDCEEDQALRAVLIGMLREGEKRQ